MTDDLPEDDWRCVQRLMFVVEDQLGKAEDPLARFEQMAAYAATMASSPDREEFERYFRILVGPLVELELKRRNGELP